MQQAAGFTLLWGSISPARDVWEGRTCTKISQPKQDVLTEIQTSTFQRQKTFLLCTVQHTLCNVSSVAQRRKRESASLLNHHPVALICPGDASTPDEVGDSAMFRFVIGASVSACTCTRGSSVMIFHCHGCAHPRPKFNLSPYGALSAGMKRRESLRRQVRPFLGRNPEAIPQSCTRVCPLRCGCRPGMET
eukprot:1160260-Pelagomonas_calceolata.AAC.6